ncbi:amidohydrolase family protein [Geothrix oryzisoli]|uniref:amidohydrolase family protein n=1 Tax=Geothrix oryzisoli TaxID=2922721 RepID=UPI001FABD9AC|nr:amidohydrolase family protein [Geothrix oryzisoli]
MQRRFAPIFDRHSHVSLYAALEGCLDLSTCVDPASALARMRSLPEDRLSLVRGWHSGRLPLSEADLAGLPPLLLVNFSLHGLGLSPGAARLLRDADPELVARHADPAWCERNLDRLLVLFGRTAGLTAAKLETWIQGLEALGVGAVEDLLLTGEAAWRVVRASRWTDRLPWWTVPAIFDTLPAEAQAECAGLKLFTDGALGARTAALGEPFRGGEPGLLLSADEALSQALATHHARGKALAIHAIGDRAIGQVLAALEDLDRQGLRFPQVRLEHAQFITEAQARRARDLGLVLSMQPNFSSDSVDYADRLGPDTLAQNNPFRMLIDRVGFRPGHDLIFGSDGMPHGLAYPAQWSLFPPFEGQRLSLEELLAGYGPAPGGLPWREVRIDEGARSVQILPSGSVAGSCPPLD